MTVRDILKMGDPRLLRVAQPVLESDFDSDALHLLISDLLDTMAAANGAGLAAPQIGVDLQVVIFGSRDANPRYPDRPLVPPTVLLNLSNIGWFGTGLAIDQHLTISRMRTLEFDRPMVRATNTGATAVIDHRGVVTHRLARATRGALYASVQGQGGAITPFAWWAARWRLQPLWILGAICVLVAFLVRGNRARRSRKASLQSGLDVSI